MPCNLGVIECCQSICICTFFSGGKQIMFLVWRWWWNIDMHIDWHTNQPTNWINDDGTNERVNKWTEYEYRENQPTIGHNMLTFLYGDIFILPLSLLLSDVISHHTHSNTQTPCNFIIIHDDYVLIITNKFWFCAVCVCVCGFCAACAISTTIITLLHFGIHWNCMCRCY